MTRRLHSAHLMLLLLISGCVIADPDSQTADTRPPSEMQSIAPAEPARDNDTPLVTNKIPSKDQIQLIQTRMRAAGFNPGPSDGILGPRTKSILVGVQSGCTLIKAFPETPDQQIRMVERPAAPALTSTKRIQPVALPSPASSNPSKNNSSTLIDSANPTPTNDEIQLVQVRLKDAGFDPGPIDGVMGPKTGTAILRYRTSRGLANSPTRLPGINGILE